MNKTKFGHDDLLEILADAIGYDSPTEMLDAAANDDATPGMCINCHYVVDDIHTQQCTECKTDSIRTCFQIAHLL